MGEGEKIKERESGGMGEGEIKRDGTSPILPFSHSPLLPFRPCCILVGFDLGSEFRTS